ncbi:MAG: hydrogenase accessory protein HypB, partial [Agathobacter sp.]|nr:hydrogenase accessory protein HypB [Agathobacter sp.]
MKDFKVIEVKRSIFEDNDADANKLRAELKEE